MNNDDERGQLPGDARKMMRDADEQWGDGYDAARARFEAGWESASASFGAMEEQLMAGSREALDAAGRYVQTNPWQAVGIGAAAGLLLGLMIGRGK